LCRRGIGAPDGGTKCWLCFLPYPGCRADRPIFHEYFCSRPPLSRRLEHHSHRLDTGTTYYPQSRDGLSAFHPQELRRLARLETAQTCGESRNAATWRSLALGKGLTSPRRESTTPGELRGSSQNAPDKAKENAKWAISRSQSVRAALRSRCCSRPRRRRPGSRPSRWRSWSQPAPAAPPTRWRG